MANIIINVAAKIFINFSPINVDMIRGEANTIPTTLNYTSGTGQQIPANTVLTYTGAGQTVTLTFPNATTISGTGSANVIIQSTPTTNAVDGAATFTYDQSTITVNIDYNSRPVINDINVSMANRAVHDFTIAEVEAQFTDVDPDALQDIRVKNDVNGNVIGYEYNIGTVGSPNYQPYVADTWIARVDIPKLRYSALNQNAAYAKSNPWEARDVEGNISQ